ncbi:MAG: beta-L-arabinofuranosidase domain-containing protein [Opitutaceae bacterium]|jgi:DUF1680 family protein
MKAKLLFPAALLSGLAPAASLAADRALIDTTASPHARMYMTDLGDTRWTTGLWADRFQVCHDVMVPHMWEIFQSTSQSHAWANFLIAAGEGGSLERRHEGPPFADGDFFKWLEATAQVYAVTRDPALDALMDRIIAVVARAQRADGYLGTATTIAQMRGEAVQAFAQKDNFETYNLGHLMTAACVHYRATGKTSLLAVARKAADFLCHFYQTASPELARSDVCPSHYMGMVELYRATRDPRYLELARNFIEIRGEVKDGTDQNQDRVPFRAMHKALGHAVRANYLYAGVADVEAETGDASLLDGLRQIAGDVEKTKLYITGATGALYDGASPDGDAAFDEIQLVHQSYGRDYQLPNLTAYNESCATVGYILWNWRMLVDTGDARYADLVEQSLDNALLAAISLDGKDYFYVNPLRKLKDFDWPMRWSRSRQPNIQRSFCCPPNVVRTIAEAQDYAYSLSKDCVWVNLYGASALDTRWTDGGRIRLKQETNYPWDGKIRIEVVEAPDRPVALKLRIPGWSRAGAASLAVDGKTWEGSLTPGTYAEVRRTWKAGDAVDLNIAFAPELWQSNPLVEETLGQVAVRCGPLVYCAESNDLPPGVRLEEVGLRPESHPRFEQKRETIAGADLVALTTDAVVRRRPAGAQGELYWRADAGSVEATRLELIPYYAWDNRGDTEMTVWLPNR